MFFKLDKGLELRTLLQSVEKLSEYDQEMPQSQTANQPTAP